MGLLMATTSALCYKCLKYIRNGEIKPKVCGIASTNFVVVCQVMVDSLDTNEALLTLMNIRCVSTWPSALLMACAPLWANGSYPLGMAVIFVDGWDQSRTRTRFGRPLIHLGVIWNISLHKPQRRRHVLSFVPSQFLFYLVLNCRVRYWPSIVRSCPFEPEKLKSRQCKMLITSEYYFIAIGLIWGNGNCFIFAKTHLTTERRKVNDRLLFL